MLRYEAASWGSPRPARRKTAKATGLARRRTSDSIEDLQGRFFNIVGAVVLMISRYPSYLNDLPSFRDTAGAFLFTI